MVIRRFRMGSQKGRDGLNVREHSRTDRAAAGLHRTGRGIWCAAAMLLLLPVSVGSDVMTPELQRSGDLKFSESVPSGLLFLNGSVVSAPYLIEASDSELHVNGSAFRITIAEMQWDDPNYEADSRSERPERQRRRDRPGRSRYQETGLTRPSRTRGEVPTSVRAATNLVDSLNGDWIVVIFEGHGIRTLNEASVEYEFCKALVTGDRSPQQAEQFASIAPHGPAQSVWRDWFPIAQVPAAVRTQMLERIRRIESIETGNLQRQLALQRIEQYSYPLTVAGMLLGVVALGHTLKWAGRGLAAGAEFASTAECTRPVVIALLLMAGLAVIDLVWTILAGQAGLMRELNPFASQFADSPLKLTLFKACATAAGCGILYVWRGRQQIQHAAWWMCLVSVLLTFRWVMFDSLMV